MSPLRRPHTSTSTSVRTYTPLVCAGPQTSDCMHRPHATTHVHTSHGDESRWGNDATVDRGLHPRPVSTEGRREDRQGTGHTSTLSTASPYPGPTRVVLLHDLVLPVLPAFLSRVGPRGCGDPGTSRPSPSRPPHCRRADTGNVCSTCWWSCGRGCRSSWEAGCAPTSGHCNTLIVDTRHTSGGDSWSTRDPSTPVSVVSPRRVVSRLVPDGPGVGEVPGDTGGRR